MEESASGERTKLQIVDALRGGAVLVVLAGHSRPGLAFPQTSWAQAVWNQCSANIGFGVLVFFVLSGFLITRLIDQGPGGLQQPDLRWFYARRMGRILPLWTWMILFGLMMVHWGDGDAQRYRYCFKTPCSSFDLPFWISLPTLSFNWFEIARGRTCGLALHWAVMWSLAIEEQFYLFYPWVLRRLPDVRRLVFFLLGIIALGPLWRAVVYLEVDDGFILMMRGSFSGFEPIAFGALLYLALKYYRSRLPQSFWGNAGITAAGAILAIFCFWGPTGEADLAAQIYYPTLGAAGVFLFLLGWLNLKIAPTLYLAPLSWMGRYSYGIYLMQASSLYFLHPLIRPLPTWMAFGAFVLTTTSVAALSFRYCEVPCNYWVRKHLGKG